MKVLNWQVGLWKAQASIENIAHNTLMAIIQVRDQDDNEKINSRHTVVFHHPEGGDTIAATHAMVHQLLGQRYGV